MLLGNDIKWNFAKFLERVWECRLAARVSFFGPRIHMHKQEIKAPAKL